MHDTTHKVAPDHLRRDAYLYLPVDVVSGGQQQRVGSPPI